MRYDHTRTGRSIAAMRCLFNRVCSHLQTRGTVLANSGEMMHLLRLWHGLAIIQVNGDCQKVRWVFYTCMLVMHNPHAHNVLQNTSLASVGHAAQSECVHSSE